MADLRGHVAIISGGAGDIGAAIARRLAEDGADVAVADIVDRSEIDPLLKELCTLGRRTRYDRVDVSKPGEVTAWVEAVEHDLGVPTLIIPNAAVVTVESVLTMRVATWSRELAINLTGAFVMAQAAAQRLVDVGRAGRIVFIGSWAGHRPHRPIPAYGVAKAGLRMLMKQMALELAEHDILVNEVAPGYVDAGLSGKLFEQEPARRRQALSQVPVRRLIEPADVAHEVAHLCDPALRHHTGAVSLMDGGLSLLSGRRDG